MIIDHWKGTRDFALFDDDQSLIAVFVYRKGAEKVKAMIEGYRSFFDGIQDKTGGERKPSPSLPAEGRQERSENYEMDTGRTEEEAESWIPVVL